MRFAGLIAAVFTAMLLTLPCTAQDEDYVYTNEDLKKYYAPDPPIVMQEEIEELFEPEEWEILEDFLATSYDRIDAERRESVARVLADQRARESRHTRYSVPYRGVYGYQAVQMWLWDRYHQWYDRPGRGDYRIPEKQLDGRDAVPVRPIPPRRARYSRPGRPDGRDAVPRRTQTPRHDRLVQRPYVRPQPRRTIGDGRDAVPRRPRPAATRRSAPRRPSHSVRAPVGRGDGRDAVHRRGKR